MADKIDVENINTPGRIQRVDAAKYHAMREATLKALDGSDAMTAAAIKDAARPFLPEALFPGGATAGWWQKTVQLDLEAKGILRRHSTKPLTFSLS